MRCERSSRCEEQYMVICASEERGEPNDAISAGTILHDHGLAPVLGQMVGQQSRGHIGTASGSEWHHQLTIRCGQGCAGDPVADSAGTDKMRTAAAHANFVIIS